MFGRWIRKKVSEAAVGGPALRSVMAPSVIASNMAVLGSIVSDGILDIDGRVDGNVRGHSVTVRPSGYIAGDLVGEEVYVYGEVQGLVKAPSVTLFSSAKVRGTILHETISIEDGAVVDGQLKRVARSQTAEHKEQPATDTEGDPAAATEDPFLDSSLLKENLIAPSKAELSILNNLRLIQ